MLFRAKAYWRNDDGKQATILGYCRKTPESADDDLETFLKIPGVTGGQLEFNDSQYVKDDEWFVWTEENEPTAT